ncbi:ComF family protein [Candidatus Saccharibacteria bacterium]|nr:ComF family protein [Candidatus Saccharibacteria bacterium]
MNERLDFPEDAVVIHVPTATSRVRQRGFDQASLLARRLARSTPLTHIGALARRGQERQVGSGRKERFEHLLSAFWVQRPELVAGKHIILIDDVITTGATLEAAASVLRKAGAKRVDAVVFAQA